MQDLTMEFVTARLTHEVSKRREKEPQGDDVAMVLTQGRGGTTSTCKDTKTCYYCGKPGHIAQFCFKVLETIASEERLLIQKTRDHTSM